MAINITKLMCLYCAGKCIVKYKEECCTEVQVHACNADQLILGTTEFELIISNQLPVNYFRQQSVFGTISALR